jgi:RNA polymerase sigma-70 factor (ECF subfamily)
MTPSSDDFRGIYERYASIVHARCRAILKSGDDAWDAVQEVFIKLHKSLPEIRNSGSLYNWLMSASTNYCISMLRRRTLEVFDEAQHSPEGGGGVPPQERALAAKRILARYLFTWDKKVREVVWYACVDGYTNAETAELTGLGESPVRKYVSNFRKANAEVLRGRGDEV